MSSELNIQMCLLRDAIDTGINWLPLNGTVNDMRYCQLGRDAPSLLIPIVMRFIHPDAVLITENFKIASYMP